VTLNGATYGPIDYGEYCFLYNFTSLCQNGGYCLAINQTPRCQCASFSSFQYTGDYCEYKTQTSSSQAYSSGQLAAAIVVPTVVLLLVIAALAFYVIRLRK
jgi:hypothetical protein